MAGNNRDGNVRVIVVLITVVAGTVINMFTDWPWILRFGVCLAVLCVALVVAVLLTRRLRRPGPGRDVDDRPER